MSDADTSSNGRADQDSANDNRTCFVIAPIGDERSSTRRRTDGLLDEVIRPVVGEDGIGLDVTAAHELPKPGSITKQVVQHLLSAELVVADLTDLNPNVMYELAVRHAKGRPVVLIADRDTSLPFDITTERAIFYEESFHGLKELKPKLRKATQAALGENEPDNPIHRVQKDFQMRQAFAGDDKMEYLMDRLDEIESVASETRSTGTGRYLKASGDVVAFADGIDRNVLFVDGDVFMGGDIRAGPDGLFMGVEAFCSPETVRNE